MTDPALAPVHAATRARITAEILTFGRSIATLSAILFFAAMAGLVLAPRGPGFLLWASAAFAMGQGYYALRIRFDAGIFSFWADRWSRGADPDADMAAFDDAIGVSPHGRPLAARAAGARRLLAWQAGFVVIQAGFLWVGLRQALAAWL